jgi:hypothetical protein
MINLRISWYIKHALDGRPILPVLTTLIALLCASTHATGQDNQGNLVVECEGKKTINAIYAGVIPPPRSGQIESWAKFQVSRTGKILRISGANIQYDQFNISSVSDDYIDVENMDRDGDRWMIRLDRASGEFSLFESRPSGFGSLNERTVLTMIQALCKKKERLL